MDEAKILELAREAGLQKWADAYDPAIIAFARLVAAAEREACAASVQIPTLTPEQANHLRLYGSVTIATGNASGFRVPDECHDPYAHPEYRVGWNDCLAAIRSRTE